MEVLFMKGKITIHHAVAFVLISLFVSFVLFSGCEKEVEKISRSTRYIELSSRHDFNEHFMNEMMFPEE